MDPVSHGIIFLLIIRGLLGALAALIVDGGFGIVVDIMVAIVGALSEVGLAVR
jgi:uncharacterized membrane protein YeaQ/YmgE (transglycosylase-associated protein family)